MSIQKIRQKLLVSNPHGLPQSTHMRLDPTDQPGHTSVMNEGVRYLSRLSLRITDLTITIDQVLNYGFQELVNTSYVKMILLDINCRFQITYGNQVGGMTPAQNFVLSIGTSVASSTTLNGLSADIIPAVGFSGDFTGHQFNFNRSGTGDYNIVPVKIGDFNSMWLNMSAVGVTVTDTLKFNGVVVIDYLDSGPELLF